MWHGYCLVVSVVELTQDVEDEPYGLTTTMARGILESISGTSRVVWDWGSTGEGLCTLNSNFVSSHILSRFYFIESTTLSSNLLKIGTLSSLHNLVTMHENDNGVTGFVTIICILSIITCPKFTLDLTIKLAIIEQKVNSSWIISPIR